jgi:hypothetical protein
VAPDGSFWVSDVYSLLKLGPDGLAVARLGEAPRSDQLREIAELVIQPDGRILAADERTNAVHVFDALGQWRYICKPGNAQEKSSPFRRISKEIVLGPDGAFAIGETWFGPDGNPREKPPGFRSPGKRAQAILRRPDGTWMEEVRAVAVSSGGELAIVDGPSMLGDETQRYVSLYTPTDAPLRLIAMPTAAGPYPSVAFDGTRVIVCGEGQVFCFDDTGQALWQFTASQEKADEHVWTPFFTQFGRTLCLFDGQRTVYRYALPPIRKE